MDNDNNENNNQEDNDLRNVKNYGDEHGFDNIKYNNFKNQNDEYTNKICNNCVKKENKNNKHWCKETIFIPNLVVNINIENIATTRT